MEFPPDGSIRDTIKIASGLLAAAGVESPLRDARILLSAASSIDAAGLIARENHRIGGGAASIFSGYVTRRINREPVSRILGVKPFWKSGFLIDPYVLDPRPDTELIVEIASEKFRARASKPRRILDLGTGSGAILCSLFLEFPASRGLGLDISADACRIASRNVTRLGLEARATIRHADWASLEDSAWDLIVSNPPSIEGRELTTLEPEVRLWDPPVALDGGSDGLDAYRSLAPLISRTLAPDGLFLTEIGYNQSDPVSELMSGAKIPVSDMRRDLAGHARVLICQRK